VHRRALLAALCATAGCSALSPSEDEATETPAPTSTPEPTPALPLTATDPAANVDPPRGVEVRNDRGETTFVTVVVEDGDRTVFTASDTVAPGDTLRYGRLVARPGVYRVVVEAETGERAVHGWVVGRRWVDPNLITRLTAGGIETWQVAICNPECPPLRARGESVGLPQSNPTDPGREVAGTVTFGNDREETVPVSLRVSDEGSRLIDYTYRLPPGVEVVVPVVADDGVYDLAVSTPDRTVERDWYVPEEQFPRFRVGADGPSPDCAFETTRVARISNARRSARTVGVALRSGDRPGESRSVRLAPGASRSVDLRAEPGETVLTVFVDGEERLTATWTICPGGPLQVLVVGDTVFVRNEDRVIASAFAT
jgi:hypothetical protein